MLPPTMQAQPASGRMINDVLEFGAGIAAGLMVGVERGWRTRRERSGMRIAGVRTYTLLGAGGALAAIVAKLINPLVAVVLVACLAGALIIAFARDTGRRDATGIVTALIVVALGLLAGAGQAALAVAASAVVTLILATRTQSHQLIARLTSVDLQAFARYAVVAAAVLPFLPNRSIGPLGAWNPFQLWLVVVLITGFSFAGYVANRTIGERKGVLATALIGGAYSSTAVTASFAQRIAGGEEGPLVAGILIASAVMYVRVIVLVAILASSTLVPLLELTFPATLVGGAVAVIGWFHASNVPPNKGHRMRNPVELIPAFGFVAIVAAGALATRWAEQQFGQSGAAASLFITGSFDVDAAIVTLSGLPPHAIEPKLAGLVLAGTIIANMAFKIFVAALYARRRSVPALLGLGASTLTLMLAVAVEIAHPPVLF